MYICICMYFETPKIGAVNKNVISEKSQKFSFTAAKTTVYAYYKFSNV